MSGRASVAAAAAACPTSAHSRTGPPASSSLPHCSHANSHVTPTFPPRAGLNIPTVGLLAGTAGACSATPGVPLPTPSSVLLASSSLAQNVWLAGVSSLALYKGFGARKRRGSKCSRTPQYAAMAARPVRFSVATFNIRGIMDRWVEREAVLRECLGTIDADVYAFQEVLTGGFEQERALLGGAYFVHGCEAALYNMLSAGGLQRVFGHYLQLLARSSLFGRFMRQLPLVLEQYREAYRIQNSWLRTLRDVTLVPFFGNSLATRLHWQELSHDVLVLGGFRAAHRLLVRVPAGPDGFKVWMVNTHLDHADQDTRAAQATEVVLWMDEVKGAADAVVLCGDLNAGAHEHVHVQLAERNYRSAHRSVYGAEPEGTWPSGIQAPLAEEGERECLDYVYVWEGEGTMCRVLDAELQGTQPAAGDPTLYASDHLALKVVLELHRTAPLPGEGALAWEGEEEGVQAGDALRPLAA